MALEEKERRERPAESSDSKVTELRNEKEITRAVLYVEEELAAYLDPSISDVAGSPSKSLIIQGLVAVVRNIGLGQTSKELTRCVDELLATVDELDKAACDMAAGAEAQVAELIAKLEMIKGRNYDLPVVTITEISNELSRRQEMRERVLHIQEKFENERDEIKERVRILNQLLAHEASENVLADKAEKQKLEHKLEALENTISSVVEAVAQNDSEVELLLSYQNAIKLTCEGLPPGLIGKNF